MKESLKLAGQASILLVDDNNHGLIARKAVLEELGYATVTAKSGEEALELFGKSRFDVVVTDFRMPCMDGRELIRAIRKAEPATHIILLSGFVDCLGLTEQSTGADVVIAKSAGEIRHLVRSVDRLLRHRIPRKPVGTQRGLPKLKAQAN
jgi:CheY-like chemotaxis protein